MEMHPVSARPRHVPVSRVTDGPRIAPGTRDLFLDTVRAVAIIRVVTWHAYGWAPITWVVSAVPAMIFVSGHLFAQSASRRPVDVVVRHRLRRLLIPYWAFAASAWLIMAGAHVVTRTPETDLPLRSIPAWILPLNDPRGSVWEGGWLSQPLWYLRVMLLLLVTAPLLWRATRLLPQLTIAVLLSATVLLELSELRTSWHPAWAPDLLWKLGDYTLYATFFAFGIAQFHGRPMAAVRSAQLGALAAISGVSWAIVSPPQGGVVNNSHILHFFIGAAWLSFAFAARAAITSFARRPQVNTVVRGIGRRSLTIYLWHSAAAITTWHLLVEFAPLPRGLHSIGIAAGTILITAAAVSLFGRLEDRAAGRAGHVVPAATTSTARRVRNVGAPRSWQWLATVAGVVVLAACAAFTVPPAWDEGRHGRPAGTAFAGAVGFGDTPGPDTGPKAPRVPSQAPRRPNFDRGPAGSAPASTVSRAPITLPTTSAADNENGSVEVAESWTPERGPVDRELADALRTAVDRWTTTWGIDGIRIAVARPGVFAWDTAIGVNWDGTDVDASASFDIESITKTFTAALMWQMVANGEIDVDATVNSIEGVPDWPADTYTVRQLLEHRSGLPDYHNTSGFAPDDQPPIERAITSSLFAPHPGGQFYSSTNYLILGRYVEDLTGESLDSLIRTRLLQSAGIEPRFSRAPSTIEAPGGGAAGLTTNLSGLLVWGETLLRRHAALRDDAWAQMSKLDEQSSLGAGIYGYCPCWFDDFGRPAWQRIGHSGGTTSLQYDARRDLLFALQVPRGVWGANTIPLELLHETLTNIVANHQFR